MHCFIRKANAVTDSFLEPNEMVPSSAYENAAKHMASERASARAKEDIPMHSNRFAMPIVECELRAVEPRHFVPTKYSLDFPLAPINRNKYAALYVNVCYVSAYNPSQFTQKTQSFHSKRI